MDTEQMSCLNVNNLCLFLSEMVSFFKSVARWCFIRLSSSKNGLKEIHKQMWTGEDSTSKQAGSMPFCGNVPRKEML
jgi:hypothetical protein